MESCGRSDREDVSSYFIFNTIMVLDELIYGREKWAQEKADFSFSFACLIYPIMLLLKILYF